MLKIIPAFKSIARDFGPILVFYFVNHFWGLKPAVVASTIYSLGEIVYKIARKEKLTLLFKFSGVTTVVFGTIDICVQKAFLFKYEACITTAFTGIFFAATLFADKTILEDFYLAKPGAKPITSDLAAYFHFLTVIWVSYFFIKAGVYFWMARRFSLDRMLVLRTIVGSGSLYAMIGLSIFGSKYLFRALKSLGFLPQPQS